MAFDYSSVKNKKRKDEKTSGFDYSSVVGKTERTEEEKREYVKQRNAQKNNVQNNRQQVAYSGRYDSEKGKIGYSNYLKTKEPKSKDIDFGNLFSFAGYTTGSNDSLPNINATAYALSKDTAYKEPGEDWLDEEKNIFGYLWENDKAAAEKYATEVNDAINRHKKDLETEKVAEYSTENLGQGILASASSVASNALSGADYLADLVEYNSRGTITEKEDYLTPYEYTQAVRGSIARDLNEYGTILGKGLGDAYQIGMSAADSFVYGHLGISDPAFFGIGATAAMNEARERGVSENQAFAYGLTSGIMEAVFEHIGIDNMLKMKSPHTLSQAFKGVLKQSGVEALEEMGTELTNTAWDAIINMDKSEFVASYANYISEGKGRGEALARAFADLGGEVLWAGISGALSGTMTGTAQTGFAKTGEIFGNAVNKADARKAVKDLGKDRDAVLDYAMETEEGSEVRKAAEDIRARTERGEKVSNKEYADVLLKTDDNFAKAEIKRQLEAEAMSTGEELSDEQIDGMSMAVLKTLRGEFVSETENAQIEQSQSAKNVYARNMGVDYTYGEQLSKEKKAELKETRTQQVLTEAVKDHSEGYKQTLTKAYEDYAQSNEALKMDAEDFANEFSSFYDIGRAGVESVDRALEAYGKGNPQLTNALARAYELGRGEAIVANKASVENKQAEIDAKLEAAKGRKVTSVGQVRLATEAELKNPKVAAVGGKVVTKGKKLSKQHRATMQFVREFAKLSGINVVLYEGGKSRGWYDSVNNEIYLNIEEGMNLKTLSHELTHFIQEHSPKQYEEFKQFLLDYYKANGKYQQLLQQANKVQRDLAAEELEDEIVANACQMFISDTDAMQKLIDTQSKGLIDTITRWFNNMCDYLRQAFEGVHASHAAAQALEEDIEMLEKARNKWYELLNESITVNKQIGTNAKNQARNYDKSKQQFELKESEKVAKLREDYLSKFSERQQVQTKLRELNKSEEYLNLLDNLVASGGTDESIEAVNKWQKESGYEELFNREKVLEQAVKEANEKYEKEKLEEEKAYEKSQMEAKGLSEADYHRNLAIKEFGYTPYFYDAGYILPNGKMLNFSGEKNRHYGSRGQDHRAIGTIFIDDISGSEAMVKFMHEGNIRIMAESPAVDFASNQVPTSEQYATIKKFIRQYAKEEYFSVDFTDERGYTIDSYEYEDNISAERIVNDIKYYFEHGETREQSDVSRFHFEIKDDEYMTAVDNGDMETAQKLVDEAAKAAGYNIHAFHGTSRGDRVGNVFLPERATSGPMAFFTDDKATAEGYATGKRDTSIAYDPDFDSYETQFRVKVSGMDIPFHRAWGYLPFDARNRVAKKAGQLREDWDGDNELILDPETNEANGGFQWQLKEARGNVIKALIDQWLNSGNLFNEEAKFLDVIEMSGLKEEFAKVGINTIYFKDPNARYEKVYDVYLKMNRPFDTEKVNKRFVTNLLKWYDKQDERKYQHENMESDLWDKNGIDAYEFAERLERDIENNTTHAWTSIPDSVTDYLKHLKYDGIKDLGGKFHETTHTVWIPFYSEQIKTTEPVTYDNKGKVIPLSERFNDYDRDIRFEMKDSEGNDLSPEQAEFFKNSKMRDENGALKVMHHGTDSAGFTVFDPLYSDDAISLFFTDNTDVAGSYSGKEVDSRYDPYHENTDIKTAEDFDRLYQEPFTERKSDETISKIRVEKVGPELKKNFAYTMEADAMQLIRSAERFKDQAAKFFSMPFDNYENADLIKSSFEDLNKIPDMDSIDSSNIEEFANIFSDVMDGIATLSVISQHYFNYVVLPENPSNMAELKKQVVGLEEREKMAWQMWGGFQARKDLLKMFETNKDKWVWFTEASNRGMRNGTKAIGIDPDDDATMFGTEEEVVKRAVKFGADTGMINVGGNRYDVYLNLENPYIYEGEEKFNGTLWDFQIHQDWKDEYDVWVKFDRNGESKFVDHFFDQYEAEEFIKKTVTDKKLKGEILQTLDEDGGGSFGNVPVDLKINDYWNKLKGPDGSKWNTRKYTQYAKDNGYDGIIFKGIYDNGGQSHYEEADVPSTIAVAFSSEQVKDIDNKKPTKDKDIRFEVKDSDGNVLSTEQEEYFRDSKARDENGNLLVLYHGGYYDTVFTGRGEGFTYNRNAIYMSEREDIASAFSYGAGNTRGNVYKLYANIKNPFVIDAEGRSYVDIPIPDDAPESLKDKFWYDNTADLDNLPVWAEQEGYDGIIVYNVREGVGGGPATEVIAFRSNQVKFVDNKAPTKDPDIRFELKGVDSSGSAWNNKKRKKGTVYDEFNSLAMRWANTTDRKEGDVTQIYNPHNQKFVIIEANGQGGYVEIISYTEKEYEERYDNRRRNRVYGRSDSERISGRADSTSLLRNKNSGKQRKIAQLLGKQKTSDGTGNLERSGSTDKIEWNNLLDYYVKQKEQFELKDEDENRLEILENQEERLVNDLKTIEKYYGDAIRQVYEQNIKPNEGISKRAEELNRKAARRFMNEVGAMFQVPKDTREKYLLPIINEMVDKGPAISDREGLIERLYQTAYEHIEDYIVDTDPEGNYKNLRNYIRKTSIFVNAGTKADVGDYNNFRKHNMGSLRLTSDQTALGLDEFYEEISNLAPEIFSGTTDGAEQLYELSSFMKDRGRTESIGDYMPQAEYTAWADETLEPELNKLFDSTVGSFLSEASRKEKERQRATKVDRAMENVSGAIRNYEAAQDYARAEGVLAGQIEQGKKDAEQLRKTTEKYQSMVAARDQKLDQQSKDFKEALKAKDKESKLAQDYAMAEGVLAGQMAQGKKDAAEMRRMQESFERKAKNYEDMLEAKRAKIKEIRQRRDEILAERKAVFKKYREQRNEAIRSGGTRKSIEKNAKTLMDWLLKNSDKEHVPEVLKTTVGDFLESIDFTSKRGLAGGEATKKDQAFAKRLNNLASMLEKQRNYMNKANDSDAENPLDCFLDLPEGFAEEIRKLADDVAKTAIGGNFVVNEMNSAQLAQLNQALRVLKTSISKMNKLITNAHFASVTEAARSSMLEMAEYKAHKPMNDISEQADKMLKWEMFTPVYAFKRYGSAGESIFKGIQKGWSDFAFAIDKVLKFAEGTYTDKEVEAWEKETHSIKLSDGKTVTLTTAQLMSLYCLNKREQARGHIYGGGIRIADIKEGKVKIQQTEPYLVSFEDVETLISELTDRQIAVADKLQKFMTEQGSEWGNKVSMERFGYRAFTEENYFPIESDANNLIAIDPEAKANDMFRLLNMSATKSLTKGANNAIVISDIFDIFSNHMSDMAKYGSLALPILDTMKWYNYKVKYDVGDGQFRTETVQKSVERAYGKAGKSYFTTFMKDLNGVKEGGRGEGFARKMVSNYKIASVGANIRVALLQPTSIVRASMEIEPKYILQALTKLPAAKKAESKSGVALWKALGFYNTDIARGVREQIKGGGKTIDKIRDKSMILAEQMDRITFGTLWNAAEAKAKDLGYSGNEIEAKTVEIFDEIIYKTQVVDSTLTRSSLMRSNSMFVSSTMAFMAEPTLSYNIVAETVFDMAKEKDFATGWKKQGKKFEKAIAVYAASSLAAAIIESIPDAIRDDDDDEWFGQKWWQAFWGERFWDGNLVSEFNILEKIPLLKDFISLRKGYDLQRLDAAWLSSLNKAFEIDQELINVYIKGEKPTQTTYWGKMTGYGAAYANLRALSQIAGLPVSNTVRDVVAIWNTIVGRMAPSLKLKTYDDSKKK